VVQPASEIVGDDRAAGFLLKGTPTRRRKMPEFPPWVAPSYFLDESDSDILILRRSDGSFVAAFSAQGATREGIREAAEEDWRQRSPLPANPRAPSVRRSGEEEDPREKVGWEEFLEMERRALEDRRGGQLGRALGQALPGESQEELDQLAFEDQRRAEEGLVEVLQEGQPFYKHIDELTPEDRMGRIRAERARTLWLQVRQQNR
jgi:hypothetical protein